MMNSDGEVYALATRILHEIFLSELCLGSFEEYPDQRSSEEWLVGRNVTRRSKSKQDTGRNRSCVRRSGT